ncbi:MAG: glycosyltransferase [Pseudomonadota bacterium]
MKILIAHYWLVSMRGGEKVVEALCEMYPDADIFTLVADPSVLSPTIKRHTIHTSFLQRLPGVKRYYTSLLPLFPFALEGFDASPYDLVISSESGPAKGIVPRPDAVHVTYVHSPMRYLWDHYHEYRREAGFITRLAMALFSPALRMWDVSTAARVDTFAANSHHIKNRIMRYWRREASVVHPPVATGDFAISEDRDDFYLCAGQLVGYKRVDLAVDAFTETGKPLVVIGTGPEEKRLKKRAGPNITFLGYQPFKVLKDHMARCRALVFPGEEDFGIIPVEVMASGRPVIALARGGALETVVEGTSGILFHDQSVAGVREAVSAFEAREDEFDPEAVRAHALTFDTERFKTEMAALIDATIANHYSRRR